MERQRSCWARTAVDGLRGSTDWHACRNVANAVASNQVHLHLVTLHHGDVRLVTPYHGAVATRAFSAVCLEPEIERRVAVV